MSTDSIRSPFPNRDLITERAARRVSAHRRPVAAPAPDVVSAGPMNPVAAEPATPASDQANGVRILRRWSVAELIARAAAGAPVVA